MLYTVSRHVHCLLLPDYHQISHTALSLIFRVVITVLVAGRHICFKYALILNCLYYQHLCISQVSAVISYCFIITISLIIHTWLAYIRHISLETIPWRFHQKGGDKLWGFTRTFVYASLRSDLELNRHWHFYYWYCEEDIQIIILWALSHLSLLYGTAVVISSWLLGYCGQSQLQKS